MWGIIVSFAQVVAIGLAFDPGRIGVSQTSEYVRCISNEVKNSAIQSNTSDVIWDNAIGKCDEVYHKAIVAVALGVKSSRPSLSYEEIWRISRNFIDGNLKSNGLSVESLILKHSK